MDYPADDPYVYILDDVVNNTLQNLNINIIDKEIKIIVTKHDFNIDLDKAKIDDKFVFIKSYKDIVKEVIKSDFNINNYYDKLIHDYDNILVKAHTHSSQNRKELSESSICGCFYCKKIFNPNEITEWIGEEEDTSLCPYCSIDSVIGDSSGYEINDKFLKDMYKYWFKD